MALKLSEVRKVAELARLELDGDEEKRFAHQLGQVVDYFGQLQQFETVASGSEALSGTSHEAEDVIVSGLQRAAFLENAPCTRDGFLIVPRVKAARRDAD